MSTAPQADQAQFWIDALNLLPHPEGGYFIETHRSAHTTAPLFPPYRPHADDSPGLRPSSTGIVYLIPEGKFSGFHRLGWEEQWFFQAGRACTITLLHPNGQVEILGLGLDPHNGYLPQRLVPAQTWFAVELAPVPGPDFVLVGCAMAPGFSYADWQMARRADLLAEFPQHAALITRLAHEEVPD